MLGMPRARWTDPSCAKGARYVKVFETRNRIFRQVAVLVTQVIMLFNSGIG